MGLEGTLPQSRSDNAVVSPTDLHTYPGAYRQFLGLMSNQNRNKKENLWSHNLILCIVYSNQKRKLTWCFIWPSVNESRRKGNCKLWRSRGKSASKYVFSSVMVGLARGKWGMFIFLINNQCFCHHSTVGSLQAPIASSKNPVVEHLVSIILEAVERAVLKHKKSPLPQFSGHLNQAKRPQTAFLQLYYGFFLVRYKPIFPWPHTQEPPTIWISQLQDYTLRRLEDLIPHPLFHFKGIRAFVSYWDVEEKDLSFLGYQDIVIIFCFSRGMGFSFGVQVLCKGSFHMEMHRFGRCKSESDQSCTESERAPGDPDPCTPTRKDTAAPAWASHEWKPQMGKSRASIEL